ncbi:DUF4097 family beta strand repeat-containing protein [Cohnella terricola]|uniref:DUF4097 domain-containing protein n=1 Tax=Cohnella terricola TaxID=1289167 RepID=A0A559JBB5_9BACL|nr:DUF4097 family beta strand repeat-containing protein [Cohnella terricola]TVX97155.1 DUF4097 domain-containing protein [Cohnella terricola]
MKKLWYLTAICLIVIGIAGALQYDWKAGDKDLRDFEKEWTFSADDLRTLSVVSDYNVSMKFIKSEDGRNSIRLKGRGTEKMIEKAQGAEIADRTLKLDLVRMPKRYINLFNFDFRNNKEEFVIAVTDDAMLDKLKIKVDSGNIDLTDAPTLSIKDADLSTDSGNLKFNDFHSDTLNIKIDSGNIKGGRLSTNLTASTDSGNITIENMTGQARISVDSGNVKLYKLDTSNAEIKTDSGNIYVQVPASFAGVYDLKVDSGRVRSPDSKHQTTDYVKVRTDSGNITIEEAGR